MRNLIETYIAEMSNGAWSKSTARSERYRLLAVAADLETNDAATLWKTLADRGMAPYTRVTTWTRIIAFWEWLIAAGHKPADSNTFKTFRTRSARQFKNAYVPHMPSITFDEAKRRIEASGDAAFKRKALELLHSGLRYTESFTLDEHGNVVGKGSKVRAAYVPKFEGPAWTASYATFIRRLSRCGLSPHDLRKLALNRLVDAGITEFQLTEVAGWSNINTALSYINNDKEKVRKLMARALGANS